MNRGRYIRRPTIFFMIAAVGLLLLSGCSGSITGPGTAPATPPSTPSALVRVITASEEKADNSSSYTGDVRPLAQVAVIAKIPGRLQEIKVDVGDSVKQGDLLAVVEHSALDAQVKQAEAAVAMASAKFAQMQAGPRSETVAQAQVNLDSAREKYEAMQAGGREEAVAQAEAALRLAQAKLAQLKAGPTPEQVAAAEAAVNAAKNQMYAVQSQADSLMGIRGSGYTQDMKDANTGVAYEQEKAAEARLEELKAGPTKEQLDQAQAAVDQAQAALEIAKKPFTDRDLKQAENAVTAARQQLSLAQNPFTSQDTAVASAQVAQAQAALDLAKTQVEDALIRAPMDSVVSERFLSPGAMAGPTSPILTLISRKAEVVFSAEESRTGQLAVGYPVSITVPSYPNQAFPGKVSSLSPAVDPRSRTFAVKVAPEDPDGKLRAGMS
ncbi:MAG: efflux RND transporter periplasmic adaptor subunit, partial [Dehalococcoidia bacterium]|nr:efflux RND transporter periplasmic adaptor subunit [Dehalococcoidia bacterium]